MSGADAMAVPRAAPESPRSDRAAPRAGPARTRLAVGRYHAADSLLATVVELDPTGFSTLHALAARSLLTGSHQAEGRSAAAQLTSVDSSLGGTVAVAWRAAMDGDTAAALAVLRGNTAPQWPGATDAIYGGLRGLTALTRGDTAAARAGLRL